MRAWIPLLLALSIGCGASSASLSNAALNTGLAAAVAGAQRAQGGCFSTCTHGLVCNRATGYCETRPCGKGCGPGQFCDDRPGKEPICSEATLLPGSSPTPGSSGSPGGSTN